MEEYLDPTVIIDSTQWPPVYKATPKGHKRKISFPSCKNSFAQDNPPVMQKCPTLVYEENTQTFEKHSLEIGEGEIGIKVCQTPQGNKKIQFDIPQDQNKRKSNQPKSPNINSSVFTKDGSVGRSRADSSDNEYVMLFNTKRKFPNVSSTLKWNENFVLKYHTMADSKLKLFTVSLSEIHKDGAKVIGNERTFKLDHFDPNKTYDLNIEVKKNFKEKTDANIAIKVQYIRNLKKQAKLAIQELIEDKKHYYELLKFAIERVKELKQNPTLVHDSPQNGGWYHQEDNHNLK